MLKVLPVLFSCFLSTLVFASETMTQAKMEKIVKQMSTKSVGEKGLVEFDYQGVVMMLISDVAHDRMRIIAQIKQFEKVTEAQKDAMLEANFHTALDARYAVRQGILYSAYIHPLSDLTEKELKSALHQVSTLALTFGGTYTSGSLTFGGDH